MRAANVVLRGTGARAFGWKVPAPMLPGDRRGGIACSPTVAKLANGFGARRRQANKFPAGSPTVRRRHSPRRPGARTVPPRGLGSVLGAQCEEHHGGSAPEFYLRGTLSTREL